MPKKRCELCLEKISKKCLIILFVLFALVCSVPVGIILATNGSKDTESNKAPKLSSNKLKGLEDSPKPVAHPMFKPVEKKGVISRENLEKMRNYQKKVRIQQKDKIISDLEKKLSSFINSQSKTQAAVNLTTTKSTKNVTSTTKTSTIYSSLVVTTSLIVTTMATTTSSYHHHHPVCKKLGLSKKPNCLKINHSQEPITTFTHKTGCPPGWIERSITGVKKCFKYSVSGGQYHGNAMKACCEMNGILPSIKIRSRTLLILIIFNKKSSSKDRI